MKKIILVTLLWGLLLPFSIHADDIQAYAENAKKNRNEVHALLSQAKLAYERYNLNDLEATLTNAYQLAPDRIDILFSIANTYILKDDLDNALRIYRKINQMMPNDIDVLTYLAFYGHYQKTDYSRYIEKIRAVNVKRADDVVTTLKNIDRELATPIRDQLPANYQSTSPAAIITLGYALQEDGSMAPTLLTRLQKTLEVARSLPEAKIIVTGGVPKKNNSEGIEMKKWLVVNGVSENKIIAENFAGDTVENFVFSRYILSQGDINRIVIISSGTHVRRCKIILQTLGLAKGDNYHITTVAALDKPLVELASEGPRKLGIYRDALRAYGLNLMTASPELLLN